MNTSSEETEAIFVIALEYGTVKSFAIRFRVVQFPKITQNTNVSLISKYNNFLNLVYYHHFHFDGVIRIYVNVSEPTYSIYQQLEKYI